MSLWSTTDLNILDWLLLFLGVCFYGVDKKDQSQSKFLWMSLDVSIEVVLTLHIQQLINLEETFNK